MDPDDPVMQVATRGDGRALTARNHRSVLIAHLPAIARSAGNNAHEDTISAHKVMINGSRDMDGHKAGDGQSYRPVHKQKLIRQGTICGRDHRQFEQSEHDDGRRVGGAARPADKWLYQ